jgi:glycine cleavage system H protein
MNFPDTYKYTKEHEWVLADAGVGTIGITEHAQEELGDIVFVDLPKVGTKLQKGDTLGSVESVKAVSDIYAPVSGEVTEVNESLAQSPEKLNSDPQGEAWLAKLALTVPEEINALLSAEEYRKYVGE